MQSSAGRVFEESIAAKKKFITQGSNLEAIKTAAERLFSCFEKGNTVFVFGNGGSAADSQHFAAEMVVRFEKERQALPCIALTTDTSILTAASNDYDFRDVFSRQLEALCGEGDVVLAISTSGGSENVIRGILTARRKGAFVIGLTGRGGGRIGEISDLSIAAAESVTARVQEIHVTVIHALCKEIEEALTNGI